MTEIINTNNNLPVKLEDLAKFVLIGRDKLDIVRSQIRAMDKLELAHDVRLQKKEEAQMLAEALLDAEVRIGEILKGMPKATRPARWDDKNIEIDTAVDFYEEKQTKNEAIKSLGFNQKQVERFQTLAENKDIVEQIKTEAREADDLPTRTAVLQAVKVKQIEQRREGVKEGLVLHELKPTDKKYRIVYADPPWMYGNSMPVGTTEPKDYYLLMSTEDICAMPVKEITEENAVLFLWTTSPHLPEALEVVKAWGFTYKTTFIWDKIKHNMGHYNSVRHEILLVCTKGACTPDVKKLFDSVQSIERTEHSKKPQEFRDIIETIYVYGNKIELFARQAPEGWDVFGNEIC